MASQATLCWLLVLIAPLCMARYTPTEQDIDGSGDYSAGTQTISPLNHALYTILPEEEIKNPNNGTTTGRSILDGILDFFKEYMLLMIVVGSLVFMMVFIVCAAVIVRQKNQATAYYPSSYPKKKYVDEKDKFGGSQAFSEVPVKAPDSNGEEPVDSTKKLQEDIAAAASSLKSPAKAVANGEPVKIEGPVKGEESIPKEEVKGKCGDNCNGPAGIKTAEKTEPVKEASSGTEEVVLPPIKGGECSAKGNDQPAEEKVDQPPVAKGDCSGPKESPVEIPLNECSGAPAAESKSSDANLQG